MKIISFRSVLLIDIGGINIRSATADIGSNEIKNVKTKIRFLGFI